MKRIFAKGIDKSSIIDSLSRIVAALPTDKTWAVEITEWKKPRTNQQNAYLFGVVYPTIIEQGGEALAGWGKADLHEYFLGEWAGTETLEGFGRVFHKPLKRSSRLTKQEFSDYLMFIETRCLDMGINIPEPTYLES